MNFKMIRAAALASAAAAALLGAPAAVAQDAAQDTVVRDPARQDASTQAPADSAALGDVVVTAERREENLQRTPVSVGVVGGDDLRTFQAGGEDLLSLAGRVPGLYAETTTGRIFPRFCIRGLGNIDFYLGASQPVSIIQDDVVLEHVVLKSNPVFDIAQGRGAARSAGVAVRPQHDGGHHQVRYDQADPAVPGSGQRLRTTLRRCSMSPASSASSSTAGSAKSAGRRRSSDSARSRQLRQASRRPSTNVGGAKTMRRDRMPSTQGGQ